MVGSIIKDYMGRGNRRLTVPGFGTFMRKESGEIIFVDLLRNDDGVLAKVLEEFGNYSEVEAMALIDRFIFETKNAVERDGSAAIEGFGKLTLDEKGVYQFAHEFSAKPNARVVSGPSVARQSVSYNADYEKKGGGRLDVVIIVAILAALIAVAAIWFAGASGNMPDFLKR
jgi:nucleoid DNA-binding protein